MKKSAALFVMVIFLCVFSIVSAVDTDIVVDTWVLTSLESNGTVQNPGRIGLSMRFMMRSDGTVSIIRNNVETDGNWTADFDSFYIKTDEGEVLYSYTLEGDTLILELNNIRYYFELYVPEQPALDKEDTNGKEPEKNETKSVSEKTGGVITGSSCSQYPAYLKKGDSAEIINVQSVPIYADDLKTIHTYAYPGKVFSITSQPYCMDGTNYYYVNFNGWEGLLQETNNDIYVVQKIDSGE